MKKIRAGSVTVGYDERGTGEPLVLLHGGESDHRMFGQFVDEFRGDLRTLALDQRDTGGTLNPSTDYTIADLAADVAAFIDAAGIDRAHVMGVSYGGMIAVQAAIDYPDRLKSVILTATSAGGPAFQEDTENLKRTSLAAFAEGPDARDRVMSELLLSPPFAEQHPEVLTYIKSILLTREPSAAQRRYEAWFNHDCTDSLPAIKVPTLILHGSDDPAVRVDNATLMAEHIPAARLKVFDGLRHGLIFEQPAAVAAAVREFIAQHA